MNERRELLHCSLTFCETFVEGRMERTDLERSATLPTKMCIAEDASHVIASSVFLNALATAGASFKFHGQWHTVPLSVPALNLREQSETTGLLVFETG